MSDTKPSRTTAMKPIDELENEADVTCKLSILDEAIGEITHEHYMLEEEARAFERRRIELLMQQIKLWRDKVMHREKEVEKRRQQVEERAKDLDVKMEEVERFRVSVDEDREKVEKRIADADVRGQALVCQKLVLNARERTLRHDEIDLLDREQTVLKRELAVLCGSVDNAPYTFQLIEPKLSDWRGVQTQSKWAPIGWKGLPSSKLEEDSLSEGTLAEIDE